VKAYYCKTHKVTIKVDGKHITAVVKNIPPPCILLRTKPSDIKTGRFGDCVVVEK